MKKLTLVLASFIFISPCFADDASSNDQVYGDTKIAASKLCDGLSTSDCLNVLQRQIAFLNSQNTASQMQDLQSQIADLKGRLDTAEHTMQQLTDQMKTQYTDLDKRIQNLASANKAVAQTQQDQGTEKLEANERALETPQNQAVPTAPTAEEEKSYKAILAVLKKKDYVRATSMLQAFLSKYPHHFYTPSALLWSGDVYLLQGQPDSASQKYQTLISSFPKSDKVPMAQLKLGFAYADENSPKAKAQLTKVIRLYANDPKLVKLAKARLDQLAAGSK